MDKINELNQKTNSPLESQDAAEKLNGIDERLRLLAESRYYWEMFKNKGGKVIYVSPAFERITGYKVEEYMSGKITFDNLIHPEDVQKAKDYSAKILLRETFNDIEIRMVRKDGNAIFVSLLSYPVITGSDEFIGFRSSIRDITERKKIEEELRRAKGELESKVKELTANLAKSNEAEAQYKKKTEEALGKLQEELKKGVQEQNAELTGKNEELQVEISKYKKTEKALQKNNAELETKLKEQLNELTQTKEALDRYNSTEDTLQTKIAKHRETEKELKQANEEMEAKLKEQINELGIYKGLATKYKRDSKVLQETNKKLEARLKERTDKFKKASELLAEHKKAEKVLQETSTNLETQLKELRAKLSKAEKLQARLNETKKGLKREQEEKRGLSIALGKAHRRLEKVEGKLLRREKKRKMSSIAIGIVHEIKEPLFNISGSLQSLQGKLKEGDPRRELASDIIKRIRKLDTTMDDISNYTRKMDLNVRKYSLERCLNTNLAIMRPICRVQRIRVNTQYSPLLPMEIDEEKINQAFYYIMENMVQAMPKGGLLNVSTNFDEPRKSAIVKINNAGPAVGKEKLKSSQQDLGLAIARRIISKHNGQIKEESKTSGKNKGITFIVRLPIQHQKSDRLI